LWRRERPKAEALGYLEATAKATADPFGMTTRKASATTEATAETNKNGQYLSIPAASMFLE
jgi:hypothetical protein